MPARTGESEYQEHLEELLGSVSCFQTCIAIPSEWMVLTKLLFLQTKSFTRQEKEDTSISMTGHVFTQLTTYLGGNDVFVLSVIDSGAVGP